MSNQQRSFSTLKSILCLIIFAAYCLGSKVFASEAQINTLSIGDREVSVWHWQGKNTGKGVILFSHGAASAPWKYDPLIQAWVKHGFTVYAPLHVDSSDHPYQAEYKGIASWRARLEDMQLLADTYGASGYIAAGHSYGALTALVKGGVNALVPEGIKTPTADSRVSLVLAFSPPPAIPGFIDKQGYSGLGVPALIQTGTKDIPMGGATDWTGHLDAFEMSAASGDRYALVLEGVDHYFGGAICRPELPGPKLMDEIKQASDISILMIDTYVLNHQASAKKLKGTLRDHGPVVLKVK